MKFEEALKKLEEIVNNLEKGDIELDKAIDNFNEAVKLIKICDDKLKDADKAISKIVDKDGNLKDFELGEK